MDELVPQATSAQERLKGKYIFDGVEEIQFGQMNEIIPEPNYFELGSRLYIQTKRYIYYGDGGYVQELYNGFHHIEGDSNEHLPYSIRQYMHAAVNDYRFPIHFNLYKYPSTASGMFLTGRTADTITCFMDMIWSIGQKPKLELQYFS